MYILFREKNWTPGMYWRMGYGERKIAAAFLRLEMQEREEAARKIKTH